VLFAPGTILYVWARREQNARLFTPVELGIFVVVLIGAAIGIYGLVTGLITPSTAIAPGVFSMTTAFGVHSEVGQLRKVMVCAPGRAHQRLTPSNCDDLLFDDVLWVDNAKRDHFDFITKMRDRGIEVLEMHNMLAETVAIPEAKKWILDNQVTANQVGLGLVDEVGSYLEGPKPRDLSETLIGGLSTQEFPEHIGGEMLALVRDAAGVNEYLLPPLP